MGTVGGRGSTVEQTGTKEGLPEGTGSVTSIFGNLEQIKQKKRENQENSCLSNGITDIKDNK